MDTILSPVQMQVLYFVGTAAIFLNAALLLFALKDGGRRWPTYTALGTSVLWWMLMVATPRPLSLKLFTTLLLLLLIVTGIFRRGRTLRASGRD